MQLNFNLTMDSQADREKQERVKNAEVKKKQAKYIPTWDEVWITGYTSHTGSVKKGIFQTKLTDGDREKLQQVKLGIEQGEITAGVEDLRKFTKTHAMSLYKPLIEVRKIQIIKDMVKNMPSNYHLINNKIDFYNLIELLQNEKEIAVDTETTGVETFGKDYIVGVSLTLPVADFHCYIPVRHNVDEYQLPNELVFTSLKPFLEDGSIKKFYHNSKFDIHMFRKEGIECKGLYLDTMIAMQILNENEPSYALKTLATKYGKYFGFSDKSMTYEELFGKCGFENTPLDIGTVYACKDTHLTYRFGKWILEQFDRLTSIRDLYFNVELPIIEISIDMEKNGFNIDLDFSKNYCQELKEQLHQLEENILKGFGNINTNSNTQLSNLIYNEWGVQDEYKGKVDAQTLKKIVSKYENEIENVKYIRDLLESRKLTKLLSTYIEPLPMLISPLDGRLHGKFNQCDTVTGRFASNSPNLQNLPYTARHMITAPQGRLIIGIDFSQIEPRFLSHISQDKEFMGAYIDGRDLYSEIASKTFKQPIEECGDGSKWRKMAKVVLLGCMYGISALSLADQFNLTKQEAEQIYIDFYNSYPTMKAWFKETNNKADTLGYVETFMGRKRRFIGHKEVAKRYKAVYNKIVSITGKEQFNIWDESKVPYNLKKEYWNLMFDYARVERQSVNAVIQGSGADIMKVAMIKINEYIIENKKDWKILATIHDEVLIEIPENTTKEEVLEVAEVQKNAVKLSVPMKVDIEVSKVWGKGVPFNVWVDKGCGMGAFDE